MTSPVRPVPGQPGIFQGPDGQMYKFSEAFDVVRYDSGELLAGTLSAASSIQFWRDKQNKNDVDANFPEAGRVVNGSEQMVLERIGFSVQQAHSVVIAGSADIKRIIGSGYLETEVNKKEISAGPCEVYPAGFGISGSTTENNTAIASNGVPSTVAMRKLAEPQLLTNKHSVTTELTFPARAWLTVSTYPTLDAANVCRVYFHGLLDSAATNN